MLNYYIWQVPGQLLSETMKTNLSIEEVEESINGEFYGLKQVSQAEYLLEIMYNTGKSENQNPWIR